MYSRPRKCNSLSAFRFACPFRGCALGERSICPHVRLVHLTNENWIFSALSQIILDFSEFHQQSPRRAFLLYLIGIGVAVCYQSSDLMNSIRRSSSNNFVFTTRMARCCLSPRTGPLLRSSGLQTSPTRLTCSGILSLVVVQNPLILLTYSVRIC